MCKDVSLLTQLWAGQKFLCLCEKSLLLHDVFKMLGFLLLNICDQFLEQESVQVHLNSCLSKTIEATNSFIGLSVFWIRLLMDAVEKNQS